MRTTITLDDDLIRKAQMFSGIKETTAIVRTALTEFVQREAARRLAALGGKTPNFPNIPRRRIPRK